MNVHSIDPHGRVLGSEVSAVAHRSLRVLVYWLGMYCIESPYLFPIEYSQATSTKGGHNQPCSVHQVAQGLGVRARGRSCEAIVLCDYARDAKHFHPAPQFRVQRSPSLSQNASSCDACSLLLENNGSFE